MWRKAESNEQPLEVQELSGNRVLVRRNITSRDTEDGVVWQCEERIMSSVEYGTREAVYDIQLRRESEIIDDYTMALIEEGVL